MRCEELVILLPCHSLEDFPLHAEGDRAEGLLAAWSAPWHPQLLAAAGKVPRWYRGDTPPENLAGRFIVVPEVSAFMLDHDWTERARSAGAVVVEGLVSRDEIVTALLAGLAAPEPQGDTPPATAAVDADLAHDFLALGFGYLLVELLTRQMRYMSNLDEASLSSETLAAARAAVAGDTDTARDKLHQAFDVLLEARERFYPVDCYLLDLTLVASTTLGSTLRQELTGTSPLNLVVSPRVLDEMATKEPASLAALKVAFDEGRVTVCSSDYAETELPLLSAESAYAQLARGTSTFTRHLGKRPTVFGRRSFGLSTALPQLLSRFDFDGVLHVALDDGQFPRGEQSKIRWEGIDGTTIDSLARLPLDARGAEEFLALPARLGNAMDHDHVASVMFAHWPGLASPWYDDLRRITSYVPVLGKLITIEEYLRQTDSASRLTRFKSDQYRAPYLKQAVADGRPDPLSRLAQHVARRAAIDAAVTLETLATLVHSSGANVSVSARHLLDNLETQFGDSARAPLDAQDLDAEIATVLPQAINRFVSTVASSTVVEPGCTAAGYVAANPLSWKRNILIDTGDATATQRYRTVEVAPLGFAWVDAQAEPPAPARSGFFQRRAAVATIATDNVLRNEHLRVTIDEATGGVRSVWSGKYRGNRLSQQIACRIPPPPPKPGDVWSDPDQSATYSRMVADTVEITAAGPPYGEITSRGRILGSDDTLLARFTQRTGLVSGASMATVDISLETEEELGDDPWNSYFAARFAWPNVDAELFRNLALGSESTTAKRIESPLFVDLHFDTARTTILTGGLPYHRRVGERMLDTLLVVRGEGARHFRLGIGAELDYPLREAMELITPHTWSSRGTRPRATSGWLFHLDARNVIATNWEPLVEDGRVVGFRARFLETSGRSGRAELRTFRRAESARQVNFLGQTLSSLRVEDDTIHIDLGRREWVQIEARWQE
ncbi:MAG: hypothetical protein KF708_20060 [Pirellulales bacterium]|nr:hypothetical protein [Pirellulales bacterium]